MFFLVRSFFCLGLVFTAMQPKLDSSIRMAVPANPVAHVAGSVDRFCDKKPALCLQAAARLANAGKDVSISAISHLARSGITAPLSPVR
jgi:hypothetical protein